MEKGKKVDLNIQMFAEDGGKTTSPQTEPVEGTNESTKVISFDEILSTNKEYQKEFDRRLNKSAETAVSNYLEKQKALENDKRTEEEKLKTMNEVEKALYKAKKAEERAEAAERLLGASNLRKTATTIATEELGIDVRLLDFIDFEKSTAETVKGDIEKIKDIFDKSLEKAINEKLKEQPPKTVVNSGATSEEKLTQDLMKYANVR